MPASPAGGKGIKYAITQCSIPLKINSLLYIYTKYSKTSREYKRVDKFSEPKKFKHNLFGYNIRILVRFE